MPCGWPAPRTGVTGYTRNPALIVAWYLERRFAVLRERLGFDGAVFSDDLSMKGAHGVGDIVERAEAAYGAGCDMVLVCNDAGSVDRVLDGWRPDLRADSTRRIAGMVARGAAPGWADLSGDMQYQLALESLNRLGEAASRFAAGPAVGEAP